MPNDTEIIYVGHFRFPDGDVAAARVYGIGMALRDAGYSVAYAGIEDSAAPADIRPDGQACRDGFVYRPAKNFGTSKFVKLRRGIYHYLTGSATMDRVRQMTTARTRAIITYHGSSPMLMRLRRFCRQRNIALVVDCTEWYDPRHMLGGPFSPCCWDSEFRMRFLQPQIGDMIAISSYLEKHYRQLGGNVLRVPPLVDLQSPYWRPIPPQPREAPELHLLYAGSPGKKDFLINALRAMVTLRAEKYPIKMHLVGATRESLGAWLRHDPDFVEELGDSVVYYGRVPHARAVELIPTGDFTIMLREDKRYAHAGFPTKLVESLSAGVPVIANATSDIPEYVRNGREGIILENHSAEAFAEGIRRIFRLPRSQWHEMRLNSRIRAEECFDYRRFIGPIGDFIERTVRRIGGES
jgi:glycosyltransferase involved in cell wall biosynthesis